MEEALADAITRSEGVSVIVAQISQTDAYQDVMSDLAGADLEAVENAN